MLGIILSLLAAICYGTAAAIQKYCIADLKKFSFKKLIKNKFWLFSILLGVVGVAFYLLALKFAPISTVQPLVSPSLLIPVLIGYFLFKEKLGTKWISVGLILVGVVILSS